MSNNQMTSTPMSNHHATNSHPATLHSNASETKANRTPDVSIVLCTYNRADMLKECIESLLEQKTHGLFDFEVVVIDNGSTDNTSQVVQDLQPKSKVPLRYFLEPQPGQVHARHRGFDEALGEWIANFDDDEVAEPDWLYAMMKLATEKGILSVGGKLRLRLPEGCNRQLHPRVRRVLGESVMWNEPRPYTRRQGPGSGTQLLHRSVLDAIGRYDVSQSLRGYDTDFYRRMRDAGIASWFAPDSIAYHVTPPNRLTFRYLQETCFHDGWTFARRDMQFYGKPRCLLVMLMRSLNIVFRHLPAWLLAKITMRQEAALAHRLMFARFEGYVRCCLKLAFPKIFKQSKTLKKYGIAAKGSP